jgi:hypothetical protein
MQSPAIATANIRISQPSAKSEIIFYNYCQLVWVLTMQSPPKSFKIRYNSLGSGMDVRHTG